jgi:hypothetical protein
MRKNEFLTEANLKGLQVISDSKTRIIKREKPMKIKIYIHFLLICGLFFCSPRLAKAQEGSTTFADGITVTIKVKAKPPLPET